MSLSPDPNPDVEALRQMIRGKTWKWFATNWRRDLNGWAFYGRFGYFMHKPHMAILARKQFIVLKRVGITFTMDGYPERENLNPDLPSTTGLELYLWNERTVFEKSFTGVKYDDPVLH